MAAASESCAICLINFVNQEIAVPSVCNHAFCVNCLDSWKQQRSICPIDRKPFRLSVKFTNYGIYCDHVKRLKIPQLICEIVCKSCSIGDGDSTRRCRECGLNFHDKCLDALNCEAQWKINHGRGKFISHEFCSIRWSSCETIVLNETQEDSGGSVFDIDPGSSISSSPWRVGIQMNETQASVSTDSSTDDSLSSAAVEEDLLDSDSSSVAISISDEEDSTDDLTGTSILPAQRGSQDQDTTSSSSVTTDDDDDDESNEISIDSSAFSTSAFSTTSDYDD